MAKKTTQSKAEASFTLDPLKEKLEKTQQLAVWIEAANEHREEFPPEVVQTVIKDYAAQYDVLLPELRELAQGASEERQRQADRAAEMDETSQQIKAQIY